MENSTIIELLESEIRDLLRIMDSWFRQEYTQKLTLYDAHPLIVLHRKLNDELKKINEGRIK